MWQIKIRKDISGAGDPSPKLGSPAQEVKSPQLLAVKTSWDWGCGKQVLLESQAVPLKGFMHRLTWTHSLSSSMGAATERHQRRKGTNWTVQHQGKCWGAAFSQTNGLAEAIFPFLSSPSKGPKLARRVNIWDSVNLTYTVCPPIRFPEVLPHPTIEPTKLFPVTFPYEWLFLVHASDFLKFSQTSSICLDQALYLLLSSPRPNTSSSQPWFTA